MNACSEAVERVHILLQDDCDVPSALVHLVTDYVPWFHVEYHIQHRSCDRHNFLTNTSSAGEENFVKTQIGNVVRLCDGSPDNGHVRLFDLTFDDMDNTATIVVEQRSQLTTGFYQTHPPEFSEWTEVASMDIQADLIHWDFDEPDDDTTDTQPFVDPLEETWERLQGNDVFGGYSDGNVVAHLFHHYKRGIRLKSLKFLVQ